MLLNIIIFWLKLTMDMFLKELSPKLQDFTIGLLEVQEQLPKDSRKEVRFLRTYSKEEQ